MDSYVDPALVEPETLRAAEAYANRHTASGLRADSVMPHAPFPNPDNPMLRYLMEGARAMLTAGTDPEVVIHQAIVHAWYEGNIEGREAIRAAT